jgi:HEAT repeat protein
MMRGTRSSGVLRGKTMRYFLGCVALLLSGFAASAETPDETIQRLKDSDPTTRAVAARRLGRQKVEAAIPALIKLLDDKDESVSYAAATALVRIGEKSVPALAAALKDDRFEGRALICLGRMGPLAKGAVKELAELPKRDNHLGVNAAVILGASAPTPRSRFPHFSRRQRTHRI